MSIVRPSWFAALAGLALVAGAQAATVKVSFIEPEKFIDAGDRPAERDQALAALEAYIVQLGTRMLPADLTLAIEVLDVDLAGRIQWLRNGQDKRIIRGGPWDSSVRSPLDEPGVLVKEGEYVLAVNGIPLDVKSDPWASFQGLGDKTVVLTVNSSASSSGARQVVVKCLTSETELRFRSWIEERRQIVDKATSGKIGYIYVQSTGVDAQNELVRQFMAQWKKDGLIIDERWNSGGQIPDRFVELLNRPILAYWAVRDGASQQWPPVALRGPQVMLINGWSGSGGDAFPTYFREAGLGPLIGTRTWGGLIGISGAPQHLNYIGPRATIVAFNRDPEAPLMTLNQRQPRPRVFPVVGDLFETVPALTAALQQERPEPSDPASAPRQEALQP